MRSTRADGGGRHAVTVLDGLSFGVPAGEVYGIIGPSGAGKTTILRLLNGLESPRAGRVLLDGEDIADLDPLELRRRVGMVFQSPALFDGSVGENVGFGLEVRGTPAAAREERVGECLDLVGLPRSCRPRDARDLSRGEQQGVAIARALAPGPEVLLMDEPTSALDPTAAARIVRLVRELNRRLEVTVVFVTHLMEQARETCDRALVVVEGARVEEGEIAQLLESPSSELTRRFVAGRMDA